MQKILVDACGWVAIVDSGLHLDLQLLEIVGPFELVLLDSVDRELRRIEEKRASTLLLDLLEQKSSLKISTVDIGNHTDDHLILLSKENSWPVITVDTKLKQDLIKSGCKVIEIAQNRRLRIV